MISLGSSINKCHKMALWFTYIYIYIYTSNRKTQDPAQLCAEVNRASKFLHLRNDFYMGKNERYNL